MVSAIQAYWINEPSQVILVKSNGAVRRSHSALVAGVRGGWRTIHGAIRAGFHRCYNHFLYDSDCRQPIESEDCVGAKQLTIGPLIPALLVVEAGGTDDLEAFMDRIFRYRADADRAAKDVAKLLILIGADVERCSRR